MDPKSQQIQLPKRANSKKTIKKASQRSRGLRLTGFGVFSLFISGAEVPIIVAFAANALCAWFIAPELSRDMDDTDTDG